MGKKSKKHKHLDPTWANLMINVAIGPQVSSLSGFSMKLAEELYALCVDTMTRLYESKEPDYKSNHEQFVVDASTICNQIYNNNVSTLLLELLDKGMPKKSNIVIPKGVSIH